MYRITKLKNRKWIVEVQKSKWTLFGIKKVWKPFITPYGIKNKCWEHHSLSFAKMNLDSHIKDLTEIIE